MTVTREQIQEALEEIRRVPLRNYETIRTVLQSALDAPADTSEALDALNIIKIGHDNSNYDGVYAAIETIRAALTRPSVPEWLLKPTKEMFEAGCAVVDANGVPAYHCEEIFKTMLAAAPKGCESE